MEKVWLVEKGKKVQRGIFLLEWFTHDLVTDAMGYLFEVRALQDDKLLMVTDLPTREQGYIGKIRLYDEVELVG